MLDHISLGNILFLDIETVPGMQGYGELNETMQYLWGIKSEQIQRRADEVKPPQESYDVSAGVYAEFGKIICISVGIMVKEQGAYTMRLKSFFGDDEQKLLEDFALLLKKYYNNTMTHYMCGHNIKEFDVPFICRRMLIHGIPFPKMLQLQDKKPWELKHLLDTLTLWRFGDYKNFTSLKLLCGVFDIPTPKDDIDGSEVRNVYYIEKDLDRIERYCRKDVIATAQLFMRYKLLPLLEDDQIHNV